MRVRVRERARLRARARTIVRLRAGGRVQVGALADGARAIADLQVRADGGRCGLRCIPLLHAGPRWCNVRADGGLWPEPVEWASLWVD